MDMIKITLNEFLMNFSDWCKNIERQNIILYTIQDSMVVFSFVSDFQFLCITNLEEIKNNWNTNERLADEEILKTFVNEFFKFKSIETKGILKYVI